MKEWFENKTVALVGNAMSLFEREYGEEIDSHDVVVRINKAAMLYTKKLASKSHGTKTDVWIFWNTSEYRNSFRKIPSNIKKMHAGHQGRIARNMNEVDFAYPDYHYAELKKHAGKYNNPTTGLIALDYISKCNPKSVSVYGFDWKETPTFTDPNMRRERGCPHNYETEKKYCTDVFFSSDKFLLKS